MIVTMPDYHPLPATADDARWIDLIVDKLHGWPKHSGTKHVAVITGPDGWFRSLGFNGLPRGLDDSNPAFAQHPLKRQMTMCAERNALLNLKTIGGAAAGGTLHADAVPCAACATAIVASGIATVVMVDVEVHSQAHGDDFWRSGLPILLAGGVAIRRHDPAIARYQAAAHKIYHPPIASGSVDWDSRFLELATYLERWQPGGTGEVIAHRPEPIPREDDKIARALGCWSPATPTGALETARRNGITVAGCTLYLSNPGSLSRERLVGSDMRIVLPDTCDAGLDFGMPVSYHKMISQDYASLVKQQHSGVT